MSDLFNIADAIRHQRLSDTIQSSAAKNLQVMKEAFGFKDEPQQQRDDENEKGIREQQRLLLEQKTNLSKVQQNILEEQHEAAKKEDKIKRLKVSLSKGAFKKDSKLYLDSVKEVVAHECFMLLADVTDDFMRTQVDVESILNK